MTNANETTKTATEIEAETCGRCGGSGRHSYNAIDGDRCYGCNGTGRRYTKRGAAAAKFLETLRSVRLDSLKVGDLMFYRAMGWEGFVRVVEIKPDALNPGYLVVDGERKNGERAGLHASPGYMVRKGFSAEEKAAHLARALEFQATLTKAGKPRK